MLEQYTELYTSLYILESPYELQRDRDKVFEGQYVQGYVVGTLV